MPDDPFSIGKRAIGPGEPVYLVAEAGVNHNGDPDLALRLVDAAAEAGADAVKFQTFRADLLAASDAPMAEYQRQRGGAASQVDMLRRLELPREAWRVIRDRARERGIAFFSTPFDLESLALLAELEVPVYKVGSGDLTNLVLLRAIADQRAAVILSTGMATIDEIDVAVADLRTRGGSPICLLQCTSAYPAPAVDANLRAMGTLSERYRACVGFSDHTVGTVVPIAAAALGASLIEKHLTLDRSLPGPDHAASSEPHEFAALAAAVREVAMALGDGIKAPRPSEMDVRMVARRSLVARRHLPAGTVLTDADLDARRPADGISPLRLPDLVGRRLVNDLPAGTRLRSADVHPPLPAE